jgi:hypothetical protein
MRQGRCRCTHPLPKQPKSRAKLCGSKLLRVCPNPGNHDRDATSTTLPEGACHAPVCQSGFSLPRLIVLSRHGQGIAGLGDRIHILSTRLVALLAPHGLRQ